MRRILSSALLALTLTCAAARAQEPLYQEPKLPGSPAAAKAAAVQFLSPERISLTPGKPAIVTLRFRVAPGLHINSHSPRDRFLIPTVFSLPEGSGVRLESAQYPSGTDYTLPAEQQTRLSVYTGDFAIEARVVAEAGEHAVEAKLHFQACDQAQCLPPKTITIPLEITAR